MVAQVVETIVPRIPGGAWSSRDMPADLTPGERRAYSRGYSRGISAHTKKAGPASVAHDGPAPAPGTPERVALGMKLRTLAIEREAERHDTCHRAGMAAVKRYRRIRMPDLAHLAYLPKRLPPAPKLTPAPKLEPAAAPVDETPAAPILASAPDPAEDVDAHPHVYVTATLRDRNGDETHVYAGAVPVGAWEDVDARNEWKRSRRAVVLEGASVSDSRGWRVSFKASDEMPDAPVDVDETPAELEPAAPADVVGAAIGSGRLHIVRVGTPEDETPELEREELEDETPECSGRTGGAHGVPYCGRNPGGCALHYPSSTAPAGAPDELEENTRDARDLTLALEAQAERVNRTRKLARRQLAAAMRARGENPADPAAWEAAKRAAGVK